MQDSRHACRIPGTRAGFWARVRNSRHACRILGIIIIIMIMIMIIIIIITIIIHRARTAALSPPPAVERIVHFHYFNNLGGLFPVVSFVFILYIPFVIVHRGYSDRDRIVSNSIE